MTPINENYIIVVGHKELILHVSHPFPKQLVINESVDNELGRFLAIEERAFHGLVVTNYEILCAIQVLSGV